LDPRAVREVDGEDLRRLDGREVESVGLPDLGVVVEDDALAVGAPPAWLAVHLDANAPLAYLKGGPHTPRPPTPRSRRGRAPRRPPGTAPPRTASWRRTSR